MVHVEIAKALLEIWEQLRNLVGDHGQQLVQVHFGVGLGRGLRLDQLARLVPVALDPRRHHLGHFVGRVLVLQIVDADREVVVQVDEFGQKLDLNEFVFRLGLRLQEFLVLCGIVINSYEGFEHLVDGFGVGVALVEREKHGAELVNGAETALILDHVVKLGAQVVENSVVHV